MWACTSTERLIMSGWSHKAEPKESSVRVQVRSWDLLYIFMLQAEMRSCWKYRYIKPFYCWFAPRWSYTQALCIFVFCTFILAPPHNLHYKQMRRIWRIPAAVMMRWCSVRLSTVTVNCYAGHTTCLPECLSYQSLIIFCWQFLIICCVPNCIFDIREICGGRRYL